MASKFLNIFKIAPIILTQMPPEDILTYILFKANYVTTRTNTLIYRKRER